jgi:two-component system nitrate/nitrite response regulator NarL
MFAEDLASLLTSDGMDVVGIAPSGAEALISVGKLLPDLALVDIGLPDMSGLVVGRTIVETYPRISVIAVTAMDAPDVAAAALRLGFAAYITKRTPTERFGEAIRASLKGETVVIRHGGAATGRLRRISPVDRVSDGVTLASQLTKREREVMELLVEGTSSAAMAERLGINLNTVRTHVQGVLTKLQVHSRLEAAAFAVRHRLVKSTTHAGPTFPPAEGMHSAH